MAAQRRQPQTSIQKKRGSYLLLEVRPSTCMHKHNPRYRAGIECLLPAYLVHLVVFQYSNSLNAICFQKSTGTVPLPGAAKVIKIWQLASAKFGVYLSQEIFVWFWSPLVGWLRGRPLKGVYCIMSKLNKFSSKITPTPTRVIVSYGDGSKRTSKTYRVPLPLRKG